MGGLGFGLPLSRLYARFFGAMTRGGEHASSYLKQLDVVRSRQRLLQCAGVSWNEPLINTAALFLCRWRSEAAEHARVRNRHVPHPAETGQRRLGGAGCGRFHEPNAQPLRVIPKVIIIMWAVNASSSIYFLARRRVTCFAVFLFILNAPLPVQCDEIFRKVDGARGDWDTGSMTCPAHQRLKSPPRGRENVGKGAGREAFLGRTDFSQDSINPRARFCPR